MDWQGEGGQSITSLHHSLCRRQLMSKHWSAMDKECDYTEVHGKIPAISIG